MADTQEHHGLLWFANRSAPRSYYFLPRRADVQRDDDGRPMVTLLVAGPGGFLTLTGMWRPGADALDGLRKEIAEREQIDDAATITLAFAPVRSVSCELVLDDGTVLARSRTSGSPPYSALFSVSLTAAQLVSAAAGLGGRPGFLAVRYRAEVLTPIMAGARFTGAGAELISWLRAAATTGPAGLRAAIEQAITDGLARVELSVPGDPSSELVTELYDRVLSRAAEAVPGLLDGGSFEVTVELGRDVEQPFSADADLATIEGRDTVRLPAGIVAPAPETAPAPAPGVRLGLDPAGAPLAWIRVRRGDATAVLTAPDFRPADPGTAGGPVTVITGYTDGSPIHRVDLPARAGELVLGARDVGLAEVTVDGRALARAGAVAAEVLLTRGPHRHTVRLGGDDWTARRWLVVPEGAAPGADYRWTATTADGRVVRHDRAHSETGEIVLASF
ncbi:hypothetical protein AB0F81_40300 [Actinoplanes sp. NPDC024001]|uniref:hypothetical protein n=1 Tax=Actinoplanes sp. NPDC024001 TaxID=3154598 RepID=UPI0033D566AB